MPNGQCKLHPSQELREKITFHTLPQAVHVKHKTEPLHTYPPVKSVSVETNNFPQYAL